jgi:phage baseplate assembly protein gpV
MNRAGVVTAFVRELDTVQGRIKVEYRGEEEGMLSSWAYMAAPMSGKGRGALFMPEKDDEVLVCYGDGDFAHPYVVGFLWNGEQVSPEKEAHNRVIVTPGGHQLRFEDKEGAKRVVLRSSGAREVLLDDKPAAGRVEITSSQNRILLDDAPDGTKVEIKAGGALGVTITLNATPEPSLAIQVGPNVINAGAAGVSIAAAGPVSISSTSAVDIKAAGVVSVSAAAVTVNSSVTNFAGVVHATAFLTI